MNQNKVMNSKYLFYHQEIDKSPHIKVIIEVVQIIDKYSIYAFLSILDECILIELEDKVNCIVD
jgi:hypothetical protein